MKSYKKMPHHHNGSLFSFTAILPHIILVIAALAGYYYINSRGLFPAWSQYIYYGLKIFIVLEIILASARSLLAPIITLVTGLIILFFDPIYKFALVSTADGWQLIIVAIIGYLVMLIVKF